MALPPEKMFLERQIYRRRRLIDAVRLMPFFALVLFFLPVFWAGQGESSSGLLYIFGAWGALIVLMAVLVNVLTAVLDRGDDLPPAAQNAPEDEDDAPDDRAGVD